MSVGIFEYSGRIGMVQLGRDLNRARGKRNLKSWAGQILRQRVLRRVQPTPANLQAYLDRFGEQVTVDTIADINKYFQTSPAGVTLGGLATGLVPLAIRASDVRPSNTAISVIGEGLAGWYLEHQRGLLPLSRPIGEGPDFTFRDTAVSPPRTIVVEVKSTQLADVKEQIRSSIVPSLQYARNVVTPGNDISCFLVEVVIRSATDFEMWELDINLA